MSMQLRLSMIVIFFAVFSCSVHSQTEVPNNTELIQESDLQLQPGQRPDKEEVNKFISKLLKKATKLSAKYSALPSAIKEKAEPIVKEGCALLSKLTQEGILPKDKVEVICNNIGVKTFFAKILPLKQMTKEQVKKLVFDYIKKVAEFYKSLPDVYKGMIQPKLVKAQKHLDKAVELELVTEQEAQNVINMFGIKAMMFDEQTIKLITTTHMIMRSIETQKQLQDSKCENCDQTADCYDDQTELSDVFCDQVHEILVTRNLRSMHEFCTYLKAIAPHDYNTVSMLTQEMQQMLRIQSKAYGINMQELQDFNYELKSIACE